MRLLLFTMVTPDNDICKKSIRRKSIPFLFILLVFTSCTRTSSGYNYNQGTLPEAPVNLSDFNTEHDDYNSTAPSLGELIPFCFSTNRNGDRSQFDIVYMPMNVNFNKTSGILKVTNRYDNWSSKSEDYQILLMALQKIKTQGNELGPNLVTSYSSNELKFNLLYSTDITGNSQISFVSNNTNEAFSEPKEVTFLNSDFEDMYPTFNSDGSRIYFCSNRNGGNFDFYYANVNSDIDIELLLSDSSDYEIFLEDTLSSGYDDKCPFIFDNTMVFSSNRAGGFGGFDLYYSTFENGAWSAPINFGEGINTEFDEYRPILIDEGVSLTQTMMVFSSNRIGGFGGFDLYYVGIEND